MTNRPASFRFATEILRRLGEELNPSFDQCILELVKNAYDADATECRVIFDNTDHPGGLVQISDDGDGMDGDAIVNRWLILGRSGRNPAQRTRMNRIPAGSKRLGRLAALRLGSIAKLNSRPRDESDREFNLQIEWSRFDAAGVVEEVPLNVDELARRAGVGKGTDVTVEGLRNKVSRAEIQSLARSLILLADPFGDNPEGFKPILRAPEFSDLERLVQNRYFADAEFHLVASLDEADRASAAVMDWKESPLFVATHNELSVDKGNPVYNCPRAKFDLWVFILNAETFSTRTSKIPDVRAWLRSFGGVHVYQNGLRVMPNGDPGNNWLEMNLSRARSPEERPSTNTSIGRVSIFDTAERLKQKTDRSGFIESDSFRELKRFCVDSLEWMARQRMQQAQKKRAKERSESATHSVRARAQVLEAIERAPAATRAPWRALFKSTRAPAKRK